MLNLVWIALGGALGSVLRYTISILMPVSNGSFPKATFVTNILACLIVGLISGLIIFKFPQANWLKYFIVIGFCGGFSTFSSFALEMFKLNNSSDHAITFTYAILSIVVGVLAVYLGYWSVKFISPS